MRIKVANSYSIVSWKWGSDNPSGEAAEVKAGDVTVTSNKGNEITKHGSEDNPAVHIARPGNDVVKKASELTVEGKDQSNGSSEEKKEEGSKDKEEASKEVEKKDEPKVEAEEEAKEDKEEPKTNGKAKAGDKRTVDKQAEDSPDAKKQKTNGTDEGEKKKPGRPKGNGPKKEKKEKKVPAQGTRRSTRNAGVEKNYGEE